MNELRSPLRLRLLLDIYSMPLNWAHPNPPQVEALRDFAALGVTEKNVDTDTYSLTPLGRAWVESVLSVPIPKPAFIDEMGRVIAYT